MASLTDYLVLSRGFDMKGGPPDFSPGGSRVTLSFNRPADVVIAPDNDPRSPVLSFTADVDRGKLSLGVAINGDAPRVDDSVMFTEGQPVTYHWVLDGQQLFRNNRNTIVFIAGQVGGTVKVRDVILWMQRNFPQLPN